MWKSSEKLENFCGKIVNFLIFFGTIGRKKQKFYVQDVLLPNQVSGVAETPSIMTQTSSQWCQKCDNNPRYGLSDDQQRVDAHKIGNSTPRNGHFEATHAMPIVKYDQIKKEYHLKNSYGSTASQKIVKGKMIF